MLIVITKHEGHRTRSGCGEDKGSGRLGKTVLEARPFGGRSPRLEVVVASAAIVHDVHVAVAGIRAFVDQTVVELGTDPPHVELIRMTRNDEQEC